MERYEGLYTARTISLHRDHHLAIIFDPNKGPYTALTIALYSEL
jgi:hypothetical protein